MSMGWSCNYVDTLLGGEGTWMQYDRIGTEESGMVEIRKSYGKEGIRARLRCLKKNDRTCSSTSSGLRQSSSEFFFHFFV